MASNFAQQERHRLCELFEEVGPDVPTLCEGWTTRDLAAHLVVREHRPDAALGIVAPPFARHSEQVRLAVAQRSWEDLVSTVRNGPPRWSPTRLAALDAAANTMEFFVHHEDVRRGAGGAEPRQLDAGLERRLWDLTRRAAKLMLRKAPAGITLTVPNGESTTPKSGTPQVEVIGPAGELALFVYGRQASAHVECVGPDDAVAAVRTASFGI